MGYDVRNQYGVITVNDKSEADKPKSIRFITPDYKEKFRIPDGEQILISYPDGKMKAFTCRFLDSCHFLCHNRAYHICEFGEMLERAHAHCEPFPEKHTVWSDMDLKLEDWITDLRAEHPGLSDEQYTEMMYETNSEYLGDERMNLNMVVGDEIIAFADLGRWNGRFSGYKRIESGNLRDCLESRQDMNEWFVDRDGEFRSTQVHHDGRNNIYYRTWKDGVDECDKEDLLADIYEGKATQAQIDRLTEKLGRAIGTVYGWNFPTEQEKVKARDNREDR